MRRNARTRTVRVTGVAVASAVVVGSMVATGRAKTPAGHPPPATRAGAPADTLEGRPQPEGGRSEPRAHTECERTLEVAHHDSVLEEQRSIGPHRSDFQRTFEHTYYTNEKNVEPYRFEFQIRDRTMTLTGLAK